MKTTRLILIVLALIVAGAACSGSTPTASESDTPGPTDTETSADGSAAFASSLSEGFGGDFKITYRISGTGQEPTDITWAQRGDETSYLIAGGEGGSDTLVIEDGTGEGAIFCSADSCFRYGSDAGNPAEAFLAPLTAFRDSISEDLPGFEASDDETIAGRDARCASWDYLGASAEACVDVDLGFLLRWSAGAEGQSFTWEAVEFTDPSDEDFEPTAEVQTFPS